MAENPSKSGKRLKLKSIPSVLGDVGLIKVISEMGTFAKLPTFGYKKMVKLL